MAAPQDLMRLLHATANGDERAFAELYRSTRSHLYGLLLRMLKRRDWAEEALQDCFIKIWQKAETYESHKGAPLTWLMTVARYRALDLLRARRPEIGMPDEDGASALPPMTLADDTQDPLARADEGQGIARMRECLGSLRPEQREALLLAYYEGCTHQELAARMGAPLGTVKSWVRRGLARLRERLDQ